MKKCNARGAALIWVVLATSVMAVISAGLIAISLSYYNSQKADSMNITQSYLNAKSGIETVYSCISSVPDSTSTERTIYDKISALSVGDETDISFSSSDDGEYVTVNVKRETELTLILTSTSNTSSDECVLMAKAEQQPFESTPIWDSLVYID
ncbi:MAG: hypothetical protein LUH08_01070 [Ruminococcus sp.]|nr:hypothetical protein [Ruminococcus sp.]